MVTALGDRDVEAALWQGGETDAGTSIIDLACVCVSGAVGFARARVLWHQGVMQLYDKTGRVAQMETSEPQKLKGWRRVWTAETAQGEIRLTAKCSSCGGWSKVARPNAEALWQS